MKLADLGQRDGWVCWLCGNAVDPGAQVGSANAASMDHVLPRKHGGTTDDANLRLAHRRCNSRRGSALPELDWPDGLALIEAAPLWQSVQRLMKRQGTAELVVMSPHRRDAEEASSWLVAASTMVTGLRWTAEPKVITGTTWGVTLQCDG